MNKLLVCYACATVRGRYHERNGIKNQDNLLFTDVDGCTVMCVADGVGAHKYADEGSLSAVNAAANTVKLYASGGITLEEIPDRIAELYRKGISYSHLPYAATTCIFVGAIWGREVIVGHVGDGLCCLKVNDSFIYKSCKDSEFANIVSPLSADGSCGDWDIKRFALGEEDSVGVFLATDGISSDIIPDREEDCAQYFLDEICGACRDEADERLEKILIGWGDDGSDDDKTVIVYSRQVKTDDSR